MQERDSRGLEELEDSKQIGHSLRSGEEVEERGIVEVDILSFRPAVAVGAVDEFFEIEGWRVAAEVGDEVAVEELEYSPNRVGETNDGEATLIEKSVQ